MKERPQKSPAVATAGEGKKKMKKKTAKSEAAPGAKPVKNDAVSDVSDARFDTSDHRFRKMPSNISKVKIDDRFKSVFSDKFAEPQAVDSRGKKRTSAPIQDMKKFYELSDGETDEEGAKGHKAPTDEPTGFHWDAESSEEEEEEEELAEVDDTVWEKDQEDVVVSEDASKRLALLGADWDTVNATDIFVLLQTYLDSTGGARKVEKVTVYPSDYGLEKMAKEEIHGPEIDGGKDGEDPEAEQESVRRYQKQRTQYYYACAECDSVATASFLYDEIDGLDIDHIFPFECDMRFVPDDIEFPHAPHSEATEVPKNYEQPKANTSLQHSKPTCTWDEQPERRTKEIKKSFSSKELAEMDMQAYLASSDSEDLDEDNVVDFRTQLLGDAEGLAESASSDDELKETPGDMEMTFNTELDEKAADIAARAKMALKGKGEVKGEKKGPWQQFLEKKKQKKKEMKEARLAERKKAKGEVSEEEEDEDDDDLLIPVKKPAKKKVVEEASNGPESDDGADAEAKADLELLVGDGVDAGAHFDLNEKRNKKKLKKLAKRGIAVEAGSDQFEVDMKDDRLGKFFDNPDFAVDPMNPEFKRTNVMDKMLQEKGKRRRADKEQEQQKFLASKEASKKKPKVAVADEDDDADMAIFQTPKKKKAKA